LQIIRHSGYDDTTSADSPRLTGSGFAHDEEIAQAQIPFDARHDGARGLLERLLEAAGVLALFALRQARGNASKLWQLPRGADARQVGERQARRSH